MLVLISDGECSKFYVPEYRSSSHRPVRLRQYSVAMAIEVHWHVCLKAYTPGVVIVAMVCNANLEAVNPQRILLPEERPNLSLCF